MAVAQIESDELAIAVRKGAFVNMFRRMVQLVAVALRLSASESGSGTRDPSNGTKDEAGLQMFGPGVAFSAALGRTLKLLVKAFPAPPPFLHRTLGIGRVPILIVTFTVIVTINIIHVVVPRLAQHPATGRIVLRLDLWGRRRSPHLCHHGELLRSRQG